MTELGQRQLPLINSAPLLLTATGRCRRAYPLGSPYVLGAGNALPSLHFLNALTHQQLDVGTSLEVAFDELPCDDFQLLQVRAAIDSLQRSSLREFQR